MSHHVTYGRPGRHPVRAAYMSSERGGEARALLHARTGPRADRPPDQQHDDRTDDRAEQTGEGEVEAVTVVLEQQVSEEPADQRAHDTKHDGADDPHRVPAGDQQSSHRAGDEPDDQQPYDEHSVSLLPPPTCLS